MTDAAALIVIRAAVVELTRHPRFAGKGRHFGPESALELLVQLSNYLDAQPAVRWSARQTGAEQGER